MEEQGGDGGGTEMNFIEAFTEFSNAMARQYMKPPVKMVVSDRTYREIRDQLASTSKYDSNVFCAGITITTALGVTQIINEHADRGMVREMMNLKLKQEVRRK